MKRLGVAAIALFCILSSGCIQTQMKVTLDGDGSGTFTLVYGMSSDVAGAMAELETMDLPKEPGGGTLNAPNLDEFDEGEIEKVCKEHDVRLKKLAQTRADGRQQVEMVIEFDRLNDLSSALTEVFGQGGWKISRTSDGNYALRLFEEQAKAEPPTDDASVDSPSPPNIDPETAGKAMEIMQRMIGFQNDLNMTFQVEVPGEIVDHNAQFVDERTLIWDVNSSNLTLASKTKPEVVFSGEGLKIEAPGQQE